MIKRICIIGLLFSCIQFVACSGSYKHSLEYSPYEPIRVAVLPFRQIDVDGKILEEKGSLLVDEVPIISSEVADSPVSLSRKLVLAELKKTRAELVSPSLIDIDLPHRNLAYPDGRFDLERIFQIPAKTYCTDFLDCDAVLFGTVKKWDRNYYGIQSQTEIEIELKLVSAKSEKVLFFASASDSDSRGLTKGPTGYSSLILEPLRGLDSELVEDLARRTISMMLEPLKVKIKTKGEGEEPPAIFAASHDAVNGMIAKQKPLIVLAFATPNGTASFSIGNYQKSIPMFENSPGHYIGEFWPLDSQQFEKQPVIMSIKGTNGRVTSLEIDNGFVSLGEK